MKREEIEKLLGGYATDTLTEEERRALFEAALADQELFDALAGEQALRESLSDPTTRRQLLRTLEPAGQPVFRRLIGWLRRPASQALVGGLVAAGVMIGIFVRPGGPPAPAPLELVRRQPPPAMPNSVVSQAPREIAPAPRPRLARKAASAAASQAAQPAPRVITIQPSVPAPAPMSDTSTAKLKQEVKLRTGGAAETVAVSEAAGVQALKLTAAPPILTYKVLRRESGGEYKETVPGAVFSAGDAVRIRLEPAESGYLYVGMLDSGQWKSLDRPGWDHRIQGGDPCLFPAEGSLEFDRPGEKQLLVVFSRRPESAPLMLGRAAAGLRGDFRDQIRPAKEAASAPDTRLVLRINLKSQ
jgi:hypothetical protein